MPLIVALVSVTSEGGLLTMPVAQPDTNADATTNAASASSFLIGHPFGG
jgi:hypothetical protein